MKNVIITLLIVFAFTFVPSVDAEEILDFTQTVIVKEDASLKITETITYDFGDLKRHGIFRDIPYRYKDRGGNYNLRLDDISVVNNQGEKYKFKISKEGDSKRIKIGDVDVLVDGKQTYVINYTIKRAINFFDDYDEIYWNVTGDKWPVKIRQSKSTLIFPTKIAEQDLQADCFVGVFGSADNCVSERYVYEGANMVKEVVFIDDILQAGSGFTIVVGLPKGIINEPSFFVKLIDVLKDNIVLLLPIIVFLYMFNLWRKKGRDVKGRGVIVAQFDAPNNLSPMGVGTIVDTRADNKDFSANIISLAVKGYLKIVKIEKKRLFKKDDYVFVSRDGSEELRKSERSILDAIFKDEYLEDDQDKLSELNKSLNYIDISADAPKIVFLSNLKNVFYKDLASIKTDIKTELTEAGYFDKDANKAVIRYVIIAFVLFFLTIFLGGFLGGLGVVSLIVSSVIILVFAVLMTRRTKKGSLAKEHALGLKMYLSVAEKDRLDFHNAPERNPKTFEKLLPYAMALGVEKKWAKQFEDIFEHTETDWYSDSSGKTFSALALTNSLGSFSSKTNSVATSSPSSASSGGSGFSGGGSGGGFGGGGGGSW
jgi:uncharacterized membrane protein